MNQKSSQEKIDFLKDTITNLLKLLKIKAEVEIVAAEISKEEAPKEEAEDEGETKTTDEIFHVNLQGEDLGIIIGYHGETLSALQLFLNMALYNKFATWSRVILDVGGYRGEQEARLKDIAAKAADRVRFSKEPVNLNPMDSFERRIIHTTIAEMEDVTTESVGEGRERRVVIKLKA